MTKTEAHKINELFKQIDNLTVENTALRAAPEPPSTDEVTARLDSIEAKLDTLLNQGKTK